MYYAPPGPGVKGRASALLLRAHGVILEPRDSWTANRVTISLWAYGPTFTR